MKEISDEREGLPSASSMERVANCPGSLTAEKLVKEVIEVGSAVAVRDQGTDIHDALERDFWEDLGDDEKAIASRLARLEEKAVAAWLSDYAFSGEPPNAIRESRLWIRDAKMRPIASAKIDVGFIVKRLGLVLDYKTGFLITTPSDVNWQVKTQAVAMAHEHGLKRVRAGLACSRLSDKLDQTDFDEAALHQAELEIVSAISAATKPDAPRRPGTWCRYCKFKPHCREYGAFSTLEVRDYEGMDQVAVHLRVQQLAPAALAQIQRKKALAKIFFEAVEARLKGMSDAELAEVGLRKKPGSNRRSITDDAKALELLSEPQGDNPPLMTREQAISAMSFTLGGVEDLLKSTLKLSSKQKAQEKCNEILKAILETNPTSPSIVEL